MGGGGSCRFFIHWCRLLELRRGVPHAKGSASLLALSMPAREPFPSPPSSPILAALDGKSYLRALGAFQAGVIRTRAAGRFFHQDLFAYRPGSTDFRSRAWSRNLRTFPGRRTSTPRRLAHLRHNRSSSLASSPLGKRDGPHQRIGLPTLRPLEDDPEQPEVVSGRLE